MCVSASCSARPDLCLRAQRFNTTKHDCEMWLENGTILEEVFDDEGSAAIPRMLYNVRLDVLLLLMAAHWQGRVPEPTSQCPLHPFLIAAQPLVLTLGFGSLTL